MLKRLSERSPSSELGSAHANHLIQKSRKSSQQNLNQTSLIQLDILETTSSTITLCWCCSGDTDYFIQQNNQSDEKSNNNESNGVVREDIGPIKISLRLSQEQNLSEWEDVYYGIGRGCVIEQLEPNSLYHIRLIPLQQQKQSTTSSYQRNIRGPVYISAKTENLD